MLIFIIGFSAGCLAAVLVLLARLGKAVNSIMGVVDQKNKIIVAQRRRISELEDQVDRLEHDGEDWKRKGE